MFLCAIISISCAVNLCASDIEGIDEVEQLKFKYALLSLEKEKKFRQI